MITPPWVYVYVFIFRRELIDYIPRSIGRRAARLAYLY
jgi:hypothetical protein